jgi:hypothetical protein
MPFKYGIATLTHLPHLFILIKVSFSGKLQTGISSDHLPPKWFTKDPEADPQQEIDEMLRVIRKAGVHAQKINQNSIFDFWSTLYQNQTTWAYSENIPMLLAHFGTSLIERALIDAFCRYHGKPFHTLLTANVFGINWAKLRPELIGHQPKDLLPKKPLETIVVRHTVGLDDPLTPAEIDEENRVNDKLPQSLTDCIRFYDLKHFKIKLNGRLEQDLNRLNCIASLFKEVHLNDFAFTLDGNEQFKNIESFNDFWQTVRDEPHLGDFFQNLKFIEQPFHRDFALSDRVGGFLRTWDNAPRIIIDESDGDMDSLPRALELGYAGVSHKNCKGVFKGIINRATINYLNRNEGNIRFLMSGEDLSNIGPVANHQDLVLQASLGNQSVERNGHHYFKGLSMFDRVIQKRSTVSFPGLYTAEEDYIRLHIQRGSLNLKDLFKTPFGTDDTTITWLDTLPDIS